MTNQSWPYLCAIDGGGSGCRSIITDRLGHVIGRGTGGAANIGADTDNAIAHIKQAIERAVQDASADNSMLSQTYAVLGLAGADSVSNHDKLRESLPFGKSRIVSDTITAIQGALGEGDGALLILGTGSAFVRRIDDKVAVFGGRGFMLSDHAGGAWLGRMLLEEALLAFDDMADRTRLIEVVLSQFEGDARKITQFSREAKPGDYAAFAPLIFEYAAQGDAFGLALTKRACHFIAMGLERMGVEKLGRFSLSGGLASSYAALPCFPYRTLYAPSLGNSLDGALRLALRDTTTVPQRETCLNAL
ncbi:BadF/BadG/BcrA/BcrD ATPase family protein [Brucella sp. BE17]|uniref:BadF/BadG/BcrA/BcrD ATPase family protein n=1 Tax=Brucella sp. BE17 TaxID=3142977 RepID=UPI0031BB15A6